MLVFLFSFIAFIFLDSFGGSSQAGTQNSFKQSSNVPQQSTSNLAITPDNQFLLAVNPDSNSITIIDLTTLNPVAEIQVGLDPRSVAVSSDGVRAFVTNRGSNSLSVIDITSQMKIKEVAVGDRPVGVLISPDGEMLAISEMGSDQVRLLNPADLSTLEVIGVSDRPYGLAFTPDYRHLLVTHLLSGDISLLTVDPFTVYLPSVITSVSEIATQKLFEMFDASASKFWFIESISTWNHVGPAPSVIVSSDGRRAYLPQTMANGIGLNTSFDTTVFPKVSVLNLNTREHQTSEHISLPETDRPVGLPWAAALIDEKDELWVVNAASNDVSVIDISDPEHPGRAANIAVGDHPTGIIMNSGSDLAFVNNTLSGTVSVIDTNAYSITNVITTTQIPLPPSLLHGKRLFFSSARSELALASWISCNTCHIEGEQDGRTWLLQYIGDLPPGEQPIIRRNTTSLLGMIETYPLRWSAEWDESADSEFSIRFEQFGEGLIEGEMHPTLGDPNQGRSYDLDCLAAFIDSLVTPPRKHALTPAEQRGRIIFESSQTACATCHPAPIYTDLQVHDVGTADGNGEWFGPLIDTPTLRFLYDSAPYLHDGSAETLWDVLTTTNPEDQHGITSHLTPQEIEDLIAYLLALPADE
jgi:YVTN family beta-propeller protein